MARRIGSSPHLLYSALGLLVASSLSAACSSSLVTPTSANECLGTSSTKGVLAFSREPIVELDDAVAAGFSDQNGRYGYVSARSNADTARAVMLPAGTTKAPADGYFVASRGDIEPFLASVPAGDPWLAYQTATSVIDAARSGALDDLAEEAAAVEIAVLLAYGTEPPRTERPSVNERGQQLFDAARARLVPPPRDIVLGIRGSARREDIRLWVEPLERYLQGVDGYRTSVTVVYAGNSFDFAIDDGPSCLVLPRLTQDQPVSVIVVHHEELPAGTVLATNEDGDFLGGLLLVDPLRTNSEFVVTAGGEQS